MAPMITNHNGRRKFELELSVPEILFLPLKFSAMHCEL